MLLFALPALVILFFKTLIIQVSANNGRISPSFPFRALMTSFPDIGFINEETTGRINEKAIGATNEIR